MSPKETLFPWKYDEHTYPAVQIVDSCIDTIISTEPPKLPDLQSFLYLTIY